MCDYSKGKVDGLKEALAFARSEMNRAQFSEQFNEAEAVARWLEEAIDRAIRQAGADSRLRRRAGDTQQNKYFAEYLLQIWRPLLHFGPLRDVFFRVFSALGLDFDSLSLYNQ